MPFLPEKGSSEQIQEAAEQKACLSTSPASAQQSFWSSASGLHRDQENSISNVLPHWAKSYAGLFS